MDQLPVTAIGFGSRTTHILAWEGTDEKSGIGVFKKATLHRTRLIARSALGLKPEVRTAFTADTRD